MRGKQTLKQTWRSWYDTSCSPKPLFFNDEHIKFDSSNFFVRVYLPLIWNYSVTHSMVLQFMWKRDFLWYGTYPWKTLRILIYVIVLLHSFNILLLFPRFIAVIVFEHGFLMLFHLTWIRFCQSTHMLMNLSLETYPVLVMVLIGLVTDHLKRPNSID